MVFNVYKCFTFCWKQPSSRVYNLIWQGNGSIRRCLYIFIPALSLFEDTLADCTERCHLPTAEMNWAGTPAILHQHHQTVILGREMEEQFARWICRGELGWLNVCIKPFGPNAPLSLLWWASSWGLFIPVEIRSRNHLGVEKTSWGPLAPSGNLNKDSSISSPEESCLLTSISHIHLLCILSRLSLLSFSETDC